MLETVDTELLMDDVVVIEHGSVVEDVAISVVVELSVGDMIGEDMLVVSDRGPRLSSG